ncbi:MAG: hypothetical protein ACP5MZ_03930 [Candidatus Micrarchaeia archaeon]
MYDAHIKEEAAAAAIAFAFISSAVCSVFHYAYVAAALLAAGLLISVWRSLHVAAPWKRIERDTLAFLDNLSMHANVEVLEARVLKSLSRNFVFYKDFKDALAEYRVSGDAAHAFERLHGYGYKYFEAAALLIRESLESGNDISYALESLHVECQEHDALKRKHDGEMANFRSLQTLGSVIFFPVFAGLSMNVLRMSTVHTAALEYGAFGTVVLLYILIVNFITPLFSERGVSARIASISMRIAIASLVLELSNMAASALV